MNKFNVGDKVKLVNIDEEFSNGSPVEVGYEFEIKVIYDDICEDNKTQMFKECELELVDEPCDKECVSLDYENEYHTLREECSNLMLQVSILKQVVSSLPSLLNGDI
jgi:hypothetical protein